MLGVAQKTVEDKWIKSEMLHRWSRSLQFLPNPDLYRCLGFTIYGQDDTAILISTWNIDIVPRNVTTSILVQE